MSKRNIRRSTLFHYNIDRSRVHAHAIVFYYVYAMPVSTAFDTWMWRIAYLYLVVPFIIFALGWLKWMYSLPVAVTVIAAMVFSLRQHQQFLFIPLRKHRQVILVCCSLLVVWVVFSGIGQFSYQNGDHYARNAVLKDLVEQPWPLVYDFTLQQPFGITEPGNYMLVYYIGYWMPAALVGKMFGLAAAHFFLFLWTILGVTLVFYFLCRHLKTIHVLLLLLFVLFGGMDVIPTLLNGNYHPLLHMEWWHNAHQQFTSNTSLLYWVFNQSIVPWLIVAMLFNNLPAKNMFFLCALCFFYAPFPFIGMVPVVAYFFFRSTGRSNLFATLFSFQNTVAAAVVMLLMLGYTSAVPAEKNFNLYMRPFTSNLVFYLVEFLVLAALLFFTNRKKWLIVIIVACLVVMSFIQYRHRPDLMMRASIPGLFILMIVSAEQWLSEKRRGIKYALAILLAIGAIGSLNEITRSVYYTGQYWYKKKIQKQEPAFSLLQPPDLFRGNNPVIVSMTGSTRSFFYRVLCRKNSKDTVE